MSLEQSKALLEEAVRESYLNYKETFIRNGNSQIEIRATDPITGAAASVYGKVDAAGNLRRVGYFNSGRPFEQGVDISRYLTTVWVDVNNAEVFSSQVKSYLSAPILLSRNNAQSFVNTLALLPGVSKNKNSSDVSLTLYGGGPGNIWFETPLSLGWNSSGQEANTNNGSQLDIENTVINGRHYLTNGYDAYLQQRDFNIGLLDGNDFLEVVGGTGNFANGNNGDDQIVVKGGQGRYLGGADNDQLSVVNAEAGTWVNGNRGEDRITGNVDGVTYRGGSENDTLQVSAGTVWGDKGADTFQAVAGAGVAVVQDYTAGEDFVKGIAGGGFTVTDQGLSYGVGNDQMLVLLNINDASQVSVI